MSTVLRGGRWGDVLPEQTNSRPETNGLSDGPHQELSGHDDSAVLVCLVLDRKTVGVACYNEMINEISVTQYVVARLLNIFYPVAPCTPQGRERQEPSCLLCF